MSKRDFILLFLLASWLFTPLSAQVRVWEEPLLLPTYRVEEPDHNPRFYEGRAYQGAQGRAYPYPMIDTLTDDRIEKEYKAVYLENEYVKICILPELGGRVFSGLDKTNDHDFFYHQHVIKPALIGMIGAWISGGIEWNFPHHHRPSVFMPIDYVMQENADGSATVWVGEIEIRHRMKWIIGLTLYPGKSYLEARLQPYNRTPLPHTFLFFANASAHSNPDYQVFFPPSTEYVTYHGKNQFAHWPVSHEIFNEIDYTQGVDLSWWKNHPEWTSMFAWNYQDDFFGGYDHGKDAGTVSVANHHVAPGKKFWEWSAGDRGLLWDDILTETDGPELELMTGAYSDNQPDYSWLQPYEAKVAHLYWYPVRGLGGIKNANLSAAVNLEVEDGQVRVAFNTTSAHQGAKVVVDRVIPVDGGVSGRKKLLDRSIEIAPDRPFVERLSLPPDTAVHEIRVSLLDKDGAELIAYQPVKPTGEPMPDTVEPPPPPERIQTIEELYYAGLRLEQFHNPALAPEPYYEEALRRDPSDYRVNVVLGIRNLKQGLFREAESRFQKAVDRATRNYTSPRDGEAYYYLGLAQRFQGKSEDAYNSLYKATWSYAFHAAAYFHLAQVAVARGDYRTALDHVDRALATNAWNTSALDLKASILRQMGDCTGAEMISRKVLDFDPLDFWAGRERYLCLRELGSEKTSSALQTLQKRMRGEVQSYLELAVDYFNSGLVSDAVDILSQYAATPAKGAQYPMVHYYLGHFWQRLGDPAKAAKHYQDAARMPAKFCFPFRLESIAVLEEAAASNPQDSKAPYYLGNLLYDHQPEEAIQEWERSRERDDSFVTVHRNLGFGYSRHQRDIPKAIASLEKAVALDSTDARILYELDVLYEQGQVDPQKRLRLLLQHRETVAKRDDASSRLVLAYLQTGDYTNASKLLSERHFHVWEGSTGVYGTYVDTHLLRGLELMSEGDYSAALQEFQRAGEYPRNLEREPPYRGGRASQVNYYIGKAYEALGQTDRAMDWYRESADAKQREEWSELRFYEGLAKQRLGETAEAEQIFSGLLAYARAQADAEMDFFAKFGERESPEFRQARYHYLMGLAFKGQGKVEPARDHFERSQQLNSNLIWARFHLNNLD